LLGPGPRLIKKRIYRAAVSQRLRNTGVHDLRNANSGKQITELGNSLVKNITYVLSFLFHNNDISGARGGVVVKALRYKPAGRGFDSRWCHWNFSLTKSFRSHYGPGVDSASNRNEYQVYFLGVKAAGA